MARRFNNSPPSRSVCSWLPMILLAVAFAWVTGCGGDGGPKRFHLSGTVTFNGKPIPAGSIVFQPDTAKGNSGPQGVAEIRDGKYDTSDGKGMIGGPHIVRITGFDRAAASEDDVVNALFGEYTVEADLPKKSDTVDFEVPADAPKAPKSSGGKEA